MDPKKTSSLLIICAEKSGHAHDIFLGAIHVGMSQAQVRVALEYLRHATAACQELDNIVSGFEPPKQG